MEKYTLPIGDIKLAMGYKKVPMGGSNLPRD